MDELQALESLLNELLNGIQGLLSSGEVLSDELQGMLAQEIQFTMDRMTQLRSQSNEPPPIGEIESQEEETLKSAGIQSSPNLPISPSAIPANVPIQPAPHESSNINGFNYNPETQELYVKFQDKYPGQNGPVYAYEGVPEYIFDIFRRGAIAPKTSGKNAWHRWKRNVAPSHGASMWALIRAGGFPYRRLT